MDKAKVAAREQFVRISNQLLHKRLMDELNNLYLNLERLASGDDSDGIRI